MARNSFENLCFFSCYTFSNTFFITTYGSFFIPVIGKVFGTDKNFDKEQQSNLKLLETGNLNDIKGIQGKYIEVLRYCLDNPKKLIVLTITSLISIQIFYSKFGKGFEFFPPIEPDYAEVVIHARGNFSRIEKDKIVNQVEKEVLKNKSIENIYSEAVLLKVIIVMSQRTLLAQ